MIDFKKCIVFLFYTDFTFFISGTRIRTNQLGKIFGIE